MKANRKNLVAIGNTVKIETPWADGEFPNTTGVVSDIRHGAQVAIINTDIGRSPRTLHVSYLR